MAAFDSFADSPNQIKTEGETITLGYKPGVPADGQGTLGWNIPAPAHGCAAGGDGRGAYCGIVITATTTPHEVSHAPVDGVYYTNDPTVDSDAHAGDTINGALVVGAFYEGEKRARNEDLSQLLVVNDVQPNTTYFFAAYAVDCQGRYHTDGVRSYSLEYGKKDEDSSPSTQVIKMNNGEGVKITDGTNLTPGQHYAFDIEINPNFPVASRPRDVVNVEFDGTDAQTYGDLIDQVNAQLQQAANPPKSPLPPHSGSHYIDNNGRLFTFDGTKYIPTPVYAEQTDPSIITSGTYWFNPQDVTLKQFSTEWNDVALIQYPTDPTLPQCDDFWFNGINAYQFNGTTWCEQQVFTTETDPSLPPGGECGLFWYDTVSQALFEWNEPTLAFVPTEAVIWDEPINQLPANTLWYDLVYNKLYKRQAATQRTPDIWVEVPDLVVTSVTPIDPINDLYWYDPEHETLKIATQFPGPGGVFIDVPFIAWHEDPSNVESCSLWWDSASNDLKVWDVVHSEWDVVKRFVQSDTNPTLPTVVDVGALWSTDDTLRRWDGTMWVTIPAIIHPTDPQKVQTGTGWLNTSTGDINIYDTTTSSWSVIDPIDAVADPTDIQLGEFWFNTDTGTLNTRTANAWSPIPYNSKPINLNKGDLWYDTTNDYLKEWNGSRYVASNGPAAFGLTAEGNLAFQTTATGSCACIMLLVPGGNPRPGHIGTGFADFHSSTHYNSYTEAAFNAPPIPDTKISEEAFVFNSLPSQILPQAYGVDGLSGTSMYDVVGVGTDGSPDERRELSDTIRAQLGYPTVDVELTAQQMDIAITGAIESLRKRSDIAYTRGFYFMDVHRGHQRYQLTNKKHGFDKIVGVMAVQRFTSAFLSAANGAGVYGQAVLQHLYSMGTFDLTSFHLVASYIETMEHLFATRITFNWDETSRVIHLHQSFTRHERLLLDCYVERTEQDLFRDRWAKSWIEKYAISQCRLMLAEIRGKYASLPGAGGGVSLNASDLAARADQDMQELYQQLDDYVTSHVEVFGLGTQLVIG